MSAVDEIEAAIAKLTGLRSSVTEPHFKAMAYYATGTQGGYTELTLVLHRTIDAQLAILRIAAQFAQITPNRYTDAGVDLARAINGTA